MVFTKQASNPVLDIGAPGEWDNPYVYYPCVLYRNHKWYMYYGGHGPVNVRIGLATSLDGVAWTRHGSNPVLGLGAGGTWDSIHVYTPTVLYRNHKWYMYYTGRNGSGNKIGLATSSDGIAWTKHASNPVLGIGAGGTWEDVHVFSISVLYRNHKWYMYYGGHDGANVRIGLATSSDGVAWTKYSSNPVLDLGAGGTWDDVRVFSPTVLYRNHKWYMYYGGADGVNYRMGLATSLDGIAWTKYSSNPVLDLGAGGTWDDVLVYTPTVLYRNHKWYMYYTGNDGIAHRIGLATSPSGV